MHTRSALLSGAGLLAVVLGLTLSGCQGPTAAPTPSISSTGAVSSTPRATASTHREFAALEGSHDATLGVTAIDTGSGRTVGYRAGERFPFASSNKAFIAAATLDGASDTDLDQVVHYTRADLLDHAPVTTQLVDQGMTVRQLLDAALRFSDNTAANLLVARLGGPSAVQTWLRGIGDDRTNVDRTEPTLNAAEPGDERDTTTPAQFAADLRGVLLGDVLGETDRTFLRDTMLACTTGDGTVRAGVDPAWPVADKTGTGEHGVRDDIAVVYAAGRAPIVVAVMSRRDSADATPDDALVAAATKTAVAALTR